MDRTKLAKVGFIGAAVSGVGLCVSAIVAECRRRKAVKELAITKLGLAIHKLDGVVKEVQIRHLEEEIQKLESGCEEKES